MSQQLMKNPFLKIFSLKQGVVSYYLASGSIHEGLDQHIKIVIVDNSGNVDDFLMIPIDQRTEKPFDLNEYFKNIDDSFAESILMDFIGETSSSQMDHARTLQ